MPKIKNPTTLSTNTAKQVLLHPLPPYTALELTLARFCDHQKLSLDLNGWFWLLFSLFRPTHCLAPDWYPLTSGWALRSQWPLTRLSTDRPWVCTFNRVAIQLLDKQPRVTGASCLVAEIKFILFQDFLDLTKKRLALNLLSLWNSIPAINFSGTKILMSLQSFIIFHIAAVWQRFCRNLELEEAWAQSLLPKCWACNEQGLHGTTSTLILDSKSPEAI